MHGPICKLFSREAFLASPQIRVIKQSCWRGFPLQLLEFWEGGTALEKIRQPLATSLSPGRLSGTERGKKLPSFAAAVELVSLPLSRCQR